MLRHNSRNFFFLFFQIFELDNTFENFDQKVKKHDFFPKFTFFFGIFFASFWAHFSKILPNSTIWKKKKKKKKNRSLSCVLTSWFSGNFSIFSLSQKFDHKKILFPFSQKISIFVKIWYQNRIHWLISIPEVYTFIYITVIIRKLQHAILFTISGLTLPWIIM